jgi:pilus assembly protein CpaF
MNNYILEQLKISLNPIRDLFEDEKITDIFIYGPEKVFVKKSGVAGQQMAKNKKGEKIKWASKEDLEIATSQIARFMKRKLDKTNPILDARLPDGSRVNIVRDPVFAAGACISIRIFPKQRLNAEKLLHYQSIDKQGLDILKSLVKLGKNILISGGTGTGKTTLLNILCGFISKRDIIVTVEDSREISLEHPFWAALESKHKLHDTDKAVELKDLVINALRMFPKWIILGEVRGIEALHMVRAFNTGHAGMGTIHANSGYDALLALENLILQAGEMRVDAVRQMVCRAIDIVVQIVRFPDDSRKIVEISEVTGLDHSVTTMLPTYNLNTLYSYKLSGYFNNKISGTFLTGGKPTFLNDFKYIPNKEIPSSWVEEDKNV